MNSVVISVGSNVPDRVSQVEEVLAWFRREFFRVKTSSVYETPDYSGKDVVYANAVLTAETPWDKDSVEKFLHLKEATQGRTDKCRALGVVPIDLDLVIYNGEVLRHHELERQYFTIGYSMIKGD